MLEINLSYLTAITLCISFFCDCMATSTLCIFSVVSRPAMCLIKYWKNNNIFLVISNKLLPYYYLIICTHVNSWSSSLSFNVYTCIYIATCVFIMLPLQEKTRQHHQCV